jgi:hypothetical protein
MKKISLTLLLAAIVTVISCKKTSVTTDTQESRTSNPTVVQTVNSYCGQTQSQTLLAGQFINSGSVTVANDQTNLYVTYTTIGGWKIQKTHLYAGKCANIPTTNSGNPQVGLFPLQTTYNPLVTQFTYTIPLSSLDSCYCVAAHAEVVLLDSQGNIIQTETGWAQGSTIGGNSWAMKFNYCTQACTSNTSVTTCSINPGDFRTQTQGGWGAVPQGNNPGAYLLANFTTAFPAGVLVGCNTYTLLLTSAQNVANFLPEGGTPAPLNQSYTNPTTINNVLAGQVVALTISVGFDNAIPNFSNSNTPLGNLVIASGVFQGFTINQLLAQANLVLGGCNSIYSAAQINAAVTLVNENFDNGTIAGSYITCP